MAKRSGFLMRQAQQSRRTADAAQRLMIQYMMDTLQMTLHQTEGWGYDRIMRLCNAWAETRKEYSPIMDPRHEASDVYREHMDRVMAEIIGKKQDLMPFEDRYPELKQIQYRTKT